MKEVSIKVGLNLAYQTISGLYTSITAPIAMGMDTALEAAFKRERALVAAGLALIVALAWAYLARLALQMGAMAAEVAMPQIRPWSAGDLLLMLVMWVVMMVAMMVPSAAPMMLMFATVHRRRREQGSPYLPTGVFLLRYVAVWSAFSALATAAQWGLQSAALVSPMIVTTAPWLGAVLLAAAGLFQWMPLKDACLAKCRSPMGFILTQWREGTRGAFVMGVRHGAFCTGCCWALMALLFVGGVMNLLWVGALSVFVLAEKVLPGGQWLGRAGGLLLIAWGGWVAIK